MNLILVMTKNIRTGSEIAVEGVPRSRIERDITMNEWGEVKLNVPTAAFYLEGPPTSMWIQLGDGTYIQKLQKQLTSISKKSRPISHTFNDKPKVRSPYYLERVHK